MYYDHRASHGGSTILTIAKYKISKGCGIDRQIELHVRPSHWHEKRNYYIVVPSFIDESIPT